MRFRRARALVVCLMLAAVVAAARPPPGPSSWARIRSAPAGYERRKEPHDSPVVAVAASVREEYLVTCSESAANFYRVVSYPNRFPDQTHLFYGALSFETRPGERAVACHLVADASQLVVIMQSPDDDLELVTFSRYTVYGAASTPRLAGWLRPDTSIESIEAFTRFHIVHPRDAYNTVWARNATAQVKASRCLAWHGCGAADDCSDIYSGELATFF